MDYRVQVLRDVPGLREVPEPDLARLAQEFELIDVLDATLCAEGEPSEMLYVLAEGQCEVLKTTPNGRRFRVAVLTPGCLFGHLGVLHTGPRTATVIARGPARVLRMPTTWARQLLRNGPLQVTSPFRRALIVALGRQLASATATTTKLAIDAGLGVAASAAPAHAPLPDSPTIQGGAAADREGDLLRAQPTW